MVIFVSLLYLRRRMGGCVEEAARRARKGAGAGAMDGSGEERDAAIALRQALGGGMRGRVVKELAFV